MAYTIFTTLPFMVCAFWTTVLALEWREAYPAKRILALFMTVCAALYFCHAVFICQESGIMRLAECVYAFCNLAVYPIYYLYISRLTNSRSINAKRLSILFPSVVIGLWVTIQAYANAPESHIQARMIIAQIIFILQIVPICIKGLSHLRHFDRKVANFYADTHLRSLTQTRRIMLLLSVCSVCSAIVSPIGRNFFAQSPLLLSIPSTIFGVMLFFVGYTGVKQKFCIDDFETETGETEEADNDEDISEQEPADIATSEEEEDAKERLAMLEHLVKKEKLYMKKDLRISDVASKMGIGRTKLSQLLNHKIGLSFSDYINCIRVERAKQILQEISEEDKTTLEDIADQCGYLSLTSFYRSFKKLTEMTPRQYKNQIDKEKEDS